MTGRAPPRSLQSLSSASSSMQAVNPLLLLSSTQAPSSSPLPLHRPPTRVYTRGTTGTVKLRNNNSSSAGLFDDGAAAVGYHGCAIPPRGSSSNRAHQSRETMSNPDTGSDRGEQSRSSSRTRGQQQHRDHSSVASSSEEDRASSSASNDSLNKRTKNLPKPNLHDQVKAIRRVVEGRCLYMYCACVCACVLRIVVVLLRPCAFKCSRALRRRRAKTRS
jgi:hypothetical protein